ncbi:MAG TPA: hypothetical protein DCZ05_12995, partial [Deltaproteobacteria bacterium]|nr:hypothetical protein [Deltaproteobacteria bacterium]
MEQTIGFVKEYLLSVVAAFALLVLFLVLVITRIVYSIVLVNVVAAFPIVQYAATAVPVAVSLLFVGFFFFVFCPVKLTKRELVIGSLITTILFFVIRPIF